LKIDKSVSVVTGGARGLGLNIAANLSARGSHVIIFDRNQDDLSKLPGSLIGKYVDVTQPEMVKQAVIEIVEEYGEINILVNNAGVIYNEPFVNLYNSESIIHSYSRFSDTVKANLDTVFITTSAVVEQMVLKRTKGVIINMSSISSCGNEGQIAYSSAKAAVNALTVTLSKELGRWGIRCNAVAPGFIDTESTNKFVSESNLKHIKSNTPLNRLGSSDEVSSSVCALIENDFINGVILKVDGGLRF